MKKTTLFFILLLEICCSFAQINTEKILIPVDDTTWLPPTRFLREAPPPMLHLYGNAILIDSSSTLSNLEIIVTDLSDDIEYDSYVTVYADMEYVYSIPNLESGGYKVELKQGKKYLSGYFAL
jgi:Protein of unknown function (DUF3244).